MERDTEICQPVSIHKLWSSTFKWNCLLCCKQWLFLLSVWIKPLCVTIHRKANELSFDLELYYWFYTVQAGSFCVCFWVNPCVWPFIWKLLCRNIIWCCLLYCKVGSNSKVLNKPQYVTVWMKLRDWQYFLCGTVFCFSKCDSLTYFYVYHPPKFGWEN